MYNPRTFSMVQKYYLLRLPILLKEKYEVSTLKHVLRFSLPPPQQERMGRERARKGAAARE